MLQKVYNNNRVQPEQAVRVSEAWKASRRAALVRMEIVRLKKMAAIVVSAGFQSYVDAEPIVLVKRKRTSQERWGGGREL